ncbi:FkbM family methyltransferase [Streptomyces sp. NPDC102340]|uniref:FkbM family methyltransferase n=1 Tax=unclassified Streptomyces TaxID=2593676 RepID=UPI003815423E
MASVYRTLLNTVARTGAQVVDLAPGAAVLARSRRKWAGACLEDGAHLVTSRGKWTGTPLEDGAHLVTRRGKWAATPLAEGAQLIVDERKSRAREHGFQKAAADYLGARHVAAMLESYGVNCVFDVGANVGQYGRRLREFGYKGRIVSFEPVPRFLEKLQKRAEGDPEWHVVPCGLGRVDTIQPMHVEWLSMSSLLPPSEYGNTRYKRFVKGGTEDIQVCRLDGLMDKALDGIDNPLPYLKMDTQGYDLEVFAGAGERISEFVGLQSEVALLRIYEGSPRMAEALAEYEREGFEVTGMYPVTQESGTGRVLEFDCVMMRASETPVPLPRGQHAARQS